MNKTSTDIVLGLGSNLGNREVYLEEAINQLKKNKIITDLIRSNIYQTKALLREGSPKEWDIDFLNMSIRGRTSLSPFELLRAIKQVEKTIGRKSSELWAPREIDIDIHIYGQTLINQEILTIPHPALLKREWCILPLAEVYPEWQYPANGPYQEMTALQIIKNLKINNLKAYN